MKKKTYIKLMAVTVLASTLLLGACGNKKESTETSSSAKTSQSSSTKASSSNKESKAQKSSSSVSSEKATNSSNQSAATADQSQATPAPESRQGQEVPAQAPSSQQASQSNQSTYDLATDRKLQDKQAEHNKRYKGVLNMVDGDFSAATGNWKGSNGETITVSSGGQFTVESADGKKENYSIKGYSYTLDDGKYNAKVGGGKVIQITTGADGAVSSVVMTQQ
ncbi:hypothetical protein [Streptococcus oralis]|uniref:Flagellar hook-length control protein FliK n=1 Tax=Streptococcus oralis TaxID=1303 RepID=A0A139QS26_STROR|nr:hypothetical protein [Streptococcus oralis]KXU05312.1 Flagellar hook-length control protein FliK [Streptococcus oralis]